MAVVVVAQQSVAREAQVVQELLVGQVLLED
jgi:hypothetical protein